MATNGHSKDAGIESETRQHPCTSRTWCTLAEGHAGPCVEVPREPHSKPDYGPRRKR